MKHIFFDIDGTLLSGDNTIPDKTIFTLNKLKENGHRIYICTGRTKGYVTNKQLLSLNFDGFVYGCGTMVECERKTIYSYILPQTLIDLVYPSLNKNGIYCVFEGPKYLYMKHEYELFHTDETHYDYLKEKLKDQLYFAYKLKRELNEMLLDLDLNYKNINASKFSIHTTNLLEKNELFSICKGLLYPISHSEYVHEMVPIGHSKGNGIKILLESERIDFDDTISFGDSVNDLEMFKSTNISVCMGSGKEEAKEKATMVTSGFDTGIYDACKKLSLI